MPYAYLDVSSNVVALSTVSRTLPVAQSVNPAIDSIITGAPEGLSVMGGRGALYHTHTSGDGTDISHYGTTLQLTEQKANKTIAIDARTDVLIAAGFTYSGKQFSLTLTAQAKITGALQVKSDPGMVYPISLNTIDDLDVYSVPDAADLSSLYLAGFLGMRKHVDSGTALKDAVRAASTQAELDAVVDTR